ncbi:MAG: tetratricopeptide repeat protein [bacterium]|nr:tetratricopeptide repeat protein [bacterium]
MNRTDTGYRKNKSTKSRSIVLGSLLVIVFLFLYSCLDNGQFKKGNDDLYFSGLSRKTTSVYYDFMDKLERFYDGQNKSNDKEKDQRHLKSAEEFFKKGEFLKAIRQYKAVVAFNPSYKSLYYKIGLCYSYLYNPQGDNKGKNRSYYDNTFKFFNKAQNKKVTDINFYFAYGVFLRKICQMEKANCFYLKGLILNPESRRHYLYYAYFLFDRRQFDEAVLVLKKHLYVLLNPRIIRVVLETEKLQRQLEDVEGILRNMRTVKRHKKLAEEQRIRLLAGAERKLRGLPDFKKGSRRLKNLELMLPKTIKTAEAKIHRLPAKTKKALVEAYCLLGKTFWDWKLVCPSSMHEPDWPVLLDVGIGYLEKALRLNPDYADAYLYISKLHLQKISVWPLKYDEYKSLSDKYFKLYQEKKKRRTQKAQKSHRKTRKI